MTQIQPPPSGLSDLVEIQYVGSLRVPRGLTAVDIYLRWNPW